MAKAILYYSFSGKTKSFAERTATETGAEIFEVFEKRKRNIITAFIPGCFQAGGLKESPITTTATGLDAYEEIVLMAPIWAGHPAPALNSMIKLLPEGKRVSIITTSGRGGYDLSKTAALVEVKGCIINETRCLEEKEL